MDEPPLFRALMRAFYAEHLGALDPADALADVERHAALLDRVFQGVEVPDGGLVVDVATGAGLAALAAAQRFPRARVLGVDLAVEAVERAREAAARAGLPDAAFEDADAEALPVADGAADVVTVVSSFNLFPDKPAALREARRVLRPGGTLVLAEAVREDDPPFEPGPGPVGERALRDLLADAALDLLDLADATEERRALDANRAWRYPPLVEGFRYVVVHATRR